MLKRILSFILTAIVLISCCLNGYSVYGKEQEATIIQIPILSNEIEEKYLKGYLFNNSECFVSIDDICKLTRSTYKVSNDNITIKQGVMSIPLDVNNNTIELEGQNIEYEVKKYNETYLLKPYAMLKLLCANCKYISESNIFSILMPPVTIYETIDFDLYNDVYYYFGNEKLSTQYISMGCSIFMDLLSRGTDAMSFIYTKGQNEYIDNTLYEISKVNIYDYSDVNQSFNYVFNERTYIAEEMLEVTGNLNKAFEDIFKEDEILNKFSESIDQLGDIAEVVSKVKSAEEKIDYDLDSYMLLRRTLTHGNLGELGMDWYITDRTEYVTNEIESRFSAYLNVGIEYIQEKLFEKGLDIISDNLNNVNESYFSEAYDIGVSVTKLLMNDTFESYESNLNAIYLSETQNNIWSVVLKLYDINTDENFNNAVNVKRLLDMLSLYNRVTIAMYKNLKKANDEFEAYDKEFSNSFDDFCNRSANNAYLISLCDPENDVCSLKDFSDYYKNDLFDEKYENIISSSDGSYTWYLEPTIEADDIIVIDNKDNFLEEGYISPYDECAIIQQNEKYGIIKYNGTNIAEPIYEFGGYDIQGAISVYNKYDQTKGSECVDVFSDKGELRIQINQERGWGYVGSTYYWDNNKQQVYQFEGSPVYGEHTNSLSFNVVVQSADIEENGKVSNVSEKYGIANQNKLIVPIEYDKGYMHSFNNVIALEKEKKWTYFDEDGKAIIENCDGFISNKRVIDWWTGGDWYNCNNDYILPYIPTENYIPVKINGQCGYYDTQGNEVIPCGTFEEVRPVHKGLAWVKKDGKWGVIELDSVEEEKNTTVTEFNVNWQEIYAKELRGYLNSKEYTSDSMFDIFDIDGDDIPELVISDSAVHMGTCKIYTISNGNLVKPNDERYGSCGVVYCSEKLHMLYGDYLQQGRFTFSFYQLTKNGVERILSGYNDEYAVFDETPTYQIDGENVTKEEYEEAYHKYNLEDFEEVGRKYELNESTIASVLLGEKVAELTEEAETISDIEILWAVNKYLEENRSHLGVWLSDSDPYCPSEYMASNDTNWSCPINLSWESYSANEIAGAYPHFAYVDKSTMKCTLTANYETVAEFDLNEYIN